jgi:ribosomal silencing factor RsfS
MNNNEIKVIADAMLEKKGQDVVSLDLKPIGTAISDYFIVCNADSTPNVVAIVDNIEEKKHGLSVLMRTQTGKEFSFNERLVSIVAVVRIDVSEYTAKHRPVPENLR